MQKEPVVEEPFLFSSVPTILSFAAAEMWLAIIAAGLVMAIFRKSRSYDDSSLSEEDEEDSSSEDERRDPPRFRERILGYLSSLVDVIGMIWNRFLLCSSVALREEMLFRWFPLIVLPAIVRGISIGFFVALSTFIFGLVHLRNYPPRLRNPLRVLPQIISGIFFAYAMLRWGFGGAVFVHFIHDFYLFLLEDALYLSQAPQALMYPYVSPLLKRRHRHAALRV
jgi:hypothetical protein